MLSTAMRFINLNNLIKSCHILQVDEGTMYLQDEFGPKEYFPDASGNNFCFSLDVGD